MSRGLKETGIKEYYSIDLVKFLCAFLVVAIHIAPFGESNNTVYTLGNFLLQKWIARIAVPFFFMTSGFLLYRKTSPENFTMEYTIRYVKRIVGLYFAWSVIYFPLHIREILTNRKGPGHGLLLYLKRMIFTGSHRQLWYLPALTIAVLITSFLFYMKIKMNWILTIAAFLYLAGLLTQSWFGLILPLKTISPDLWSLLLLVKRVIITCRNGLFEGVLFVCMGANIAWKGFRLKQKEAVVGFCLSMLLMLGEIFFVTRFHLIREYDMYFFLVPATYLMFGLTVNWNLQGEASVYRMIRNMSSLIFYLHMWVEWIVIRFFSKIGFGVENCFLLYGITAVICLMLSWIFIRSSKTTYMKWIKKLY